MKIISWIVVLLVVMLLINVINHSTFLSKVTGVAVGWAILALIVVGVFFLADRK